MAFKFEQLLSLQRRKMAFLLLIYVLIGVLAFYLIPKLTAQMGMIFSIFFCSSFAFGLGWILTKILNYFIQARCPNCSSSRLTENFALQCKMPEYQCNQCQRIFSEKST